MMLSLKKIPFLICIISVLVLTGCKQKTITSDAPITPSTTVSIPHPTDSPCAEKHLKILNPQPNEIVNFPLDVEVIIDNTDTTCRSWTVFEGQGGTVELQDENKQFMGTAVLKTTQEWMTSDPVTYKALLQPQNPLQTQKAFLIFHSENPSGLPENEQIFTLPISIKK